MGFEIVIHWVGHDGQINDSFDNESQARELFNQYISEGQGHPDEEGIELRNENGIIEYHAWEVN